MFAWQETINLQWLMFLGTQQNNPLQNCFKDAKDNSHTSIWLWLLSFFIYIFIEKTLMY